MKHLRLPNENVHVYGRAGVRKTKVLLEAYEDPIEMMAGGMEEFIYKQAKMINYGESKKPNAYLHQAICSSPRHSMLAKIFYRNLNHRIKELGIDFNADKGDDLGLDSPKGGAKKS